VASGASVTTIARAPEATIGSRYVQVSGTLTGAGPSEGDGEEHASAQKVALNGSIRRK
jgi:hypothetical protein